MVKGQARRMRRITEENIALKGQQRDSQLAFRQLQEQSASTQEALSQRVRELSELAARDGLTSIFNRRKLRECLRGEIAQARRTGAALAVIMYDVDNLKLVNDQHGHLSGDRVLLAVTAIAQSSLRGGDIHGRWGGDEFVIVAPKTEARGAIELATRIGEAIRAVFERQSLPVRCSFGVAVCRAGEELNSLLERVDRALYQAKRTGRDRVVCAS